ncbi:MAG: ABC transporter permease subunit [Chloroflexi bacterium]|nr:ABC transporter permease subunit [Chloroflexota bacterium]
MVILIVARYTLLEAMRRRVLLAMVVLSLAYLGLFALGLSLLYQEVAKEAGGATVGAANALLMFSALMTLLGFYAFSFLASLLALFAAAGALAGEVESGVIHAVLAKPVRRSDVVLGKWLGQTVIIAVYVAAMTAGMVAASQIAAGYAPPDPVLAAIFIMWSSLILLSLGTLGGTFLPTLANGVAVFLLFGLSRVGGLIESLGQMVRSAQMVDVGIGVSLLIPNDVLWQAASYYLQPTAMILAQNASSGAVIPFASATPPTTAMLLWSAGYVAAALVGAVLIFRHRDL